MRTKAIPLYFIWPLFLPLPLAQAQLLTGGANYKKQHYQETLKKFSRGRDVESEEKELEEQTIDSFFDSEFDYSHFTGRVTDRDKTANILKIGSENKNTRFFQTGDRLNFRLASHKTKMCDGTVRSVEEGYFVIHVSDWEPCFPKGEYFRRGSMLVFSATSLSGRVRDAALYRLLLIKRRKNFFDQLNGINGFLWSYKQQRVREVTLFDQKIMALQRQKQRALEDLLAKKEENIKLQKELVLRLDQLDRDLEIYRVDKDEPMIDRWHLDHNLGIPVEKRPGKRHYGP